MNKPILYIDPGIQIPNIILKSDIDNKVNQVTCKSSGRSYVAMHYNAGITEKPIYNFDGYYEFRDNKQGFIGKNLKIDYTKSHVIELWWRGNNLATSTTQYLISHSTTANINAGVFVRILAGGTSFATNLVTLTPSLVGETLADGTWFHLMFIIDQDSTIKRTLGFINGKFTANAGVPSFGNSTADFGIGITPYGGGQNSTNGDIRGIKIYPGLGIRTVNQSLPSIGEQVFVPENFFYNYRKYLNDGFNKMFITSNYTQDSLIDASSNILEINNQISNTLFIPTIESNYCKISKKGIYFPGTNTSLKSDGVLCTADNVSNILMSCWFKPDSSIGNQTLLALHTSGFSFAIGMFSGNFGIYNGVQIEKTDTLASIDKYYHILCIKTGLDTFLYINGVFVLQGNHSISSITGNLTLYIGSFNESLDFTSGYADDFLLRLDDLPFSPNEYLLNYKVINPTTKGLHIPNSDNFDIYPLPPQNLTNILVIVPWTSTADKNIYISRDDGQTWETNSYFIDNILQQPFLRVNTMHISRDTKHWVLECEESTNHVVQYFVYSHDYGITFNTTYTNGGAGGGFSRISSDGQYMLTPGWLNYGLSGSIDSGSTYKLFVSGTIPHANMSASGQYMIASYDNSVIAYSNNYGNSWNNASTASSMRGYVTMSECGQYCLYRDSGGSRSQFSLNFGQTWSSIVGLNSGNQLLRPDSTGQYVTGMIYSSTSQNIKYSIDYGQTFYNASVNGSSSTIIMKNMAEDMADNGLQIIFDYNNIVYYSKDFGQTYFTAYDFPYAIVIARVPRNGSHLAILLDNGSGNELWIASYDTPTSFTKVKTTTNSNMTLTYF